LPAAHAAKAPLWWREAAAEERPPGWSVVPVLKRVLIANRGEIAIRIARAAAGLGIETVAVHSPADAQALHTRVANQAVAIGGAEPDPVKPYLDADALIAAAQATGCDAVHPGYGFLSENAGFARRCQAEGLVFVGPAPETLELFGDKVRARALARSLGVPVVPGSDGPLASAADAAAAAQAVGYPVMLKAAAGGGGRGMRRVDRAADLEAAFARCASEAESAFGDGAVFLEKLVEQPRHIEVQVLADGQGGLVHLWERDCSVQARNQKVVEIAPAAGLDPGLRGRILEHALRLAAAADYLNAGTVEFLVQPETGAHHFIECNPRIQVEHTVTEEITGVDMVEAQFRIAAGERLADLGLAEPPPARGFAVQARISATGAGTLVGYKEPTGPGVRVDSCGYPGLTPPPQFDPMFAKVIARSNSSGSLASALDRCRRALAEFHIEGLPANLGQLQAILAAPAVRAGEARTTLIAEHPELAAGAAAEPSRTLSLLAPAGPPPRGRGAPPQEPPSLPLDPGEEGVESPMAGAVVEMAAQVGGAVQAGDTLMVVSAMKMETSITAPVAGVVTRLAAIAPGAQVAAGQIVAAIAPAEGAQASGPRAEGEGSWRATLDQVAELQAIAHARFAPGSADPGVVRQRSRGKLTCRERIDALLDPGSFREVGSLAGFASYDADGAVADFTPANHSAAGARSRAGARSSAPTTSPPAAGTPMGRSARSRATSTSSPWSSAALRCACSTAPPAAARWRRWCPGSRAKAKARPRSPPAPSGRAVRGWRVAAAPSCPATWAARCTPASWPPCRWSMCCWAAWWASAPPRRCSATSR
jgi:acetyl/propionyl-CoA carboxylase alpha subunit